MIAGYFKKNDISKGIKDEIFTDNIMLSVFVGH